MYDMGKTLLKTCYKRSLQGQGLE